MLEAAHKAVQLVAGMTLQELEGDEIRCLALTHLIEILGEAASGVSPETKAALPELPWAKMAATRNRLIHGYFSVDLEILWEIASADLQPVIATLRGVVEPQD
jgi:uncharacterized protein with HEPN domain